MPSAMSFDIYMKSKLDYSIWVLHIQFFLDSLEIQANQGSIHPTLTIQKVFLALNVEIVRNSCVHLILKYACFLLYVC